MINSPLHAILYLVNHAEVIHVMEKYCCLICGHVYDPKKGEPLQDVPPGKDFTGLPDDWQCPVCGAMKKNFRKE